MELNKIFEEAVTNSKLLSSKPSNDTLLALYGLYKQATEGDVNIDSPSNPFDFVAKAKYEAWAGLKGKNSDTAKQEYIDLVNKLRG